MSMNPYVKNMILTKAVVDEEFRDIMASVSRLSDRLDDLRRSNNPDDIEMKVTADMLYLASYYRKDERVQGAFRKLWFELLEAGGLGD